MTHSLTHSLTMISLTCTDGVVTTTPPALGAQASVQVESIEAHRLTATLHAHTLVHVYECGETQGMCVRA